MARLNIEDCWWTDPRRSALAILFGSEELADIRPIRAWRLAQSFWRHGRRLVPKELFDVLPGSAEMIKVGLADVRDTFVYVRGSSSYLDWIAEQRENAKAAGKKSAEARKAKFGSAQPGKKEKKHRTTVERPSNSTRTESNDIEPSYSYSSSSSASFSESNSDSEIKSFACVLGENKTEDNTPRVNPEGLSPTAKTWRAYKAAYEKRWGEPPVWNAKLAGQFKSFVSRVPSEEAPDIAAYYLTHPDAFYVKSMHPVGLMLRDAEKIRTEWKTRRQVTSLDGKSAETFGFVKSQMERIASGEL